MVWGQPLNPLHTPRTLLQAHQHGSKEIVVDNSNTMNGHAPADAVTSTIAPTDINYDDAVRKGKAIVASLSGKQWELGDLTAQVEKAYGENRLEQFAVDINFPGAACTLSRYRSVCVAFPKTGGRPLFFGSAQKLQTHPDRHQIVRDNPEITKREAIALMHAWRAKQEGTPAAEADDDLDAADDLEATDTEPAATPPSPPAKAKGPKVPISDEQVQLNEVRRLFNIVVGLTNDASDAAADVLKEERSDLLKIIEPRLVKEVRKGAEALMDLCDELDQLLAEAAETLEQEGSVRTSPKPAGESHQVGA
jgi:hypothetical protein